MIFVVSLVLKDTADNAYGIFFQLTGRELMIKNNYSQILKHLWVQDDVQLLLPEIARLKKHT